MDQKTGREKQKQVLQGLKQIFDLTGYFTEWMEAEQNGLADLLRAEHPEVGSRGDEVLGEYYFLPSLTEQVNVMNLVVSMTITDDLSSEAGERIQRAITKINYVLPFGGFVLNETEEILSYRYVISYFEDEEVDYMVRKASYHVGMALQFTALWIDSLLDLESGRLSEQKFMDDFTSYYMGEKKNTDKNEK